ncbi:hypothetical protein [Burkholderia ubonensis]|uniref:hypothetical protein n=1 Tax=Burkholderia ubonensis TaxID=101571 RepID=UPI0012F96586|nr:hypothetical protein [Burkholderia ubonensis]
MTAALLAALVIWLPCHVREPTVATRWIGAFCSRLIRISFLDKMGENRFARYLRERERKINQTNSKFGALVIFFAVRFQNLWAGKTLL